MRRLSPFLWISSDGASVHASVPGLYAWAVTVAPLLWLRGSAFGVVQGAVAVAPLLLVSGAMLERHFGRRVRFISLWGFVVACAVAWVAAPSGRASLQLDGLREMSGMLGWGLFAFAFAAPPLREAAASEPVPGVPLRAAHRQLARGDGYYVAAGAIVAIAIQFVGLDIANAERALLVRFVVLAAGLAMIGTSTELAFARHGSRIVRSPRSRFRSLFAPLILLAILLAAGMLVATQG